MVSFSIHTSITYGTTRAEQYFGALRGEVRVRERLAAGGRRIRTLGPPVRETLFSNPLFNGRAREAAVQPVDNADRPIVTSKGTGIRTLGTSREGVGPVWPKGNA
jgi:hypothetical protein